MTLPSCVVLPMHTMMVATLQTPTDHLHHRTAHRNPTATSDRTDRDLWIETHKRSRCDVCNRAVQATNRQRVVTKAVLLPGRILTSTQREHILSHDRLSPTQSFCEVSAWFHQQEETHHNSIDSPLRSDVQRRVLTETLDNINTGEYKLQRNMEGFVRA